MMREWKEKGFEDDGDGGLVDCNRRTMRMDMSRIDKQVPGLQMDAGPRDPRWSFR